MSESPDVRKSILGSENEAGLPLPNPAFVFQFLVESFVVSTTVGSGQEKVAKTRRETEN